MDARFLGYYERELQFIREMAGEFAEGRLVSVLEGGYNQVGLAKAVRHHVEALMGK